MLYIYFFLYIIENNVMGKGRKACSAKYVFNWSHCWQILLGEVNVNNIGQVICT